MTKNVFSGRQVIRETKVSWRVKVTNNMKNQETKEIMTAVPHPQCLEIKCSDS